VLVQRCHTIADVPLVRRSIASVLDGRLGSDLTDRVVLAASEVMTNAVCHADGALVRMWWNHATGGVRIEVTDASRERPVVGQPSLDSVDGRGLYIVDAVTSRFGTQLRPAGKTVWFEIDP
jgi:anti-sigma regulatory factor (Ser/Thr protein kinase)